MFGTCAGCILMSKSIDGMPDQKTLQLADISVNRFEISCLFWSHQFGCVIIDSTGTHMDLRGTALKQIFVQTKVFSGVCHFEQF
jgi:glutamine amidotransferase PdxT